ncbi:hypothetical protein [Tenacibaculum sp. nBUS_03]|uniref:hypothetical protein n=1 Tax=Tenacibaculum sp. nBUS_03 TaxID=3395320 RepID=UPI003EBA21AA
MTKKLFITFFLIVSLILGIGISGGLYGMIIKERKHSDIPILIISLILITIICVYLLKLFFKKKEQPQKTPTYYKPFIKWEYDINLWKQFKEQEYKIYLKERVKSVLFTYLIFFVVSGIPIMLYISFKLTILFLGYGIWALLMSFIGILIYENECYVEVKNKYLNSKKPTITLNSFGFTINDEYINIENRNTEYVTTYMCLKYINKILCLNYYISKKYTSFGSFDNTGDTVHYGNKNYNIPILNKVELQEFLMILERNRGIKINSELLDN